MRLLLIANPVAGRNARPLIDQAFELLQPGNQVKLALTTAAGDAERWAAEAAVAGKYDRLVVAGGDGTLNEVINGLADRALPVALLPLGTTNVFALEAGIPSTLPAACLIALQSQPQTIQLGRVGQRYFLLMAGVGFDAETVRRVRPGIKRLLGKGAYLISALSTWVANRPFSLHVSTEHGQYEVAGAIISNCRFYGGPFSITPDASMLKDSFDVCLFRRWNRRILLHHALKLLRNRPLDSSLVETLSCRQLTIETVGVPIQIDGDFFGQTPASFTIGSKCLQMVLPEKI